MKQLFLVLVWTLVAQTALLAQEPSKKSFISGKLEDSLKTQPVSNATVSLINTRDSSLEAFTRTDENGYFAFNRVAAGTYRLAVSHVNFHPLWKNFSVHDSPVELGLLQLRDKSLLADITVLATRPPVVINGDTLEFNAESFKTKPNAVVEDMLKKMPGVEIGRDGSIRINGRPINRVLVNGKDFFNGDPKMATRNLSADAVDKVQVFEKLSDQAAFTGVDDGNSEKTINLKLKKDKKNAAFGKASLAAGNNDRFDGQFNINKFKGDQQLSALGMTNNTNRQGFSIMDMLNFTGQNRKMMSGGGGMIINTGDDDEFGLPVAGINNNQGITTTTATGLNYNDTWKKKTEVNASYFCNNLRIDNNRRSQRENIGSSDPFTSLQSSANRNNTESHRLNLSIDQKIDSFNSLKLTSILGKQKGNSRTEAIYQSYIPFDKVLNDGYSNSKTATVGENISSNLLYKHKFGRKGRTLSANISMQYNNSRANSFQDAMNQYYHPGMPATIDTIDQNTQVKSVTASYGGTITYTEPLSKRSLLEFRSFYNMNRGDLDRNTYDYNNGTGKHDKQNARLSAAFESDYTYGGAGLSYRVQHEKFSMSAGANVQQGSLSSHLKDSAFSVRQTFKNVLPVANATYNFSKMKSLRFDYSTALQQPTAIQLQPVQNLSDPLNIRQGNPLLTQQYSHTLNLQFFAANPSKRSNLLAFINYVKRQNAIVSSDEVSATGVRTTTPVNTNGVYSLLGAIEKGFRVKKLNSRFGVGINSSYLRSGNFINHQRNTSSNLAITPRISAEYDYKEKLNISLIGRYSLNKASYSLLPNQDNRYSRLAIDFEATANLPWGINLYNELTYSKFDGRADGYNTATTLWNASISKQLLKNKKGEIKFSAFDLLMQQTGVDRNANANYIEDISYQTLQRYFTVGFTYSLQRPTTGGPKAVIRTF